MDAFKAHAVILMPDGQPQIWPLRGRSLEEFGSFCATCGAAVLSVHPNLSEATSALHARTEWTPELPNWLKPR
jgi:hypothetical protein